MSCDYSNLLPRKAWFVDSATLRDFHAFHRENNDEYTMFCHDYKDKQVTAIQPNSSATHDCREVEDVEISKEAGGTRANDVREACDLVTVSGSLFT